MSLEPMGWKHPNILIPSKDDGRPLLRRMDLVIQLYLYNWEAEQTSYYKQAKRMRQYEINECFLRNLHHPCIQTVHVLCDTETTLNYYTSLAKEYQKDTKCVFVHHGKQPTYADFLQYVRQTLPENHIVCIQNSDIYIECQALNLNYYNLSGLFKGYISLLVGRRSALVTSTGVGSGLQILGCREAQAFDSPSGAIFYSIIRFRK